MKLLIEQSVLLEGLNKVSAPALAKQNISTLNSVLIETEVNNKIKLTTTDLNTTIITILDAEIQEQGKTLVSFKQFMSIIREFPSKKINLELLKNNLSIRCENIELEMNTFNINDFPKIEYPQNALLIRIDPQELLQIIKLTSFCVGYDDTNYTLTGVLFEINNDTIRGVSTDGKRLSVATRKLPPNQPELKTGISFILPLRAINEVQRVLKDREEDIFFYTESNNVGFDLKDTKIITRPIEGEFPNYNQYLPKPQENKLVINRNDIFSSLKRAALFSTPDFQSVTLDIKKDKLTISKSTPHIAKIKEELNCQYSGEYFSVGFNPYYLIDVLKNIDDPIVNFEFVPPDNRAVIRKEGYLHLIVPIII